ncbi:uncharacterized protein LOC114931578 [Nylanderia fulva]|uniref:uncharacterized protein LOC114931578 n=1 Tax=Nylanderia fulva TaxID=613905 RepID=UPI0010FAD154|nr:uncharacterized protein LOC114931578 [Nylanderia fulva]
MDVPTLVDCQREIQIRISRSVEYLKKLGSSNITTSAIATRTRILDQLWTKFEAQHDLIRASLKEKFSESDYFKSELHADTENLYVNQRSILDGYAEHFRASSVPPSADVAPRSSLPRIKVPPFSGAYADWPSFRDLFLSVVSGNAISNIERFHHLRSCLTGPAEKLIKSLPVTKELRRIHNAVTAAVNGQESIGRPINTHGMDLFNFLVTELFDARTRLEWESSTSDSSEPAQNEALVDFISRRILTLNAARPKSISKPPGETSRIAKTHFTKQQGAEPPHCTLCRERHTLMTCRDFKAKTVNERKAFVETNKLCYNCLGNHLVSRCQSKKNCLTCDARHHTTLHEATTSSPAAEVTTRATTLTTTLQDRDHKAVLLATARLNIADRYGSPHVVRALIDQCSEVSIISEALAQRLRLPRVSTDLSIFGIGGTRSGSARGKVTLHVTSDVTNAELRVVAFVLPRISLQQGSVSREERSWPHLNGLQLADLRFLDDDPAELLLGAEVYSLILEEGLRKGDSRMPIAQQTSLGWILSGGYDATTINGHRRTFRCTADHDLADLVRRFWEQESKPITRAPLTPEEATCEELYVRTVTRTSTGRYMVRLPISSPPTNLHETRRPAERLLRAMEVKGSRDPRFGDLYRNFMQEFEDLQHIKRVNIATTADDRRCYLPHHGVLKESSTTTKLRVVFNGSQRTRAGTSLNSHLLTGANLLPALNDVLLRWRWHRYVFVTDVEKMYRQILVHPEDCRLQTILWRHNKTDEIQEYELRTVTYGMACAPFLAIRTLRQLCADEGTQFPLGAAALRRDCYVDDVVTGADDLDDAINLQTELRHLCTAGGFPLRKWASNNSKVLAGVPQEHRLQQGPHSWDGESHSTLGL